MKRITLLLSVFLWVFAATGQSFEMDPQDYEKLLQIRNAENNAKELVLSMDRAPLSNHQVQPGQVQHTFRDGHIGLAWNVFAGASGLLEGPINLNLETGVATSIVEVDSDIIWMAAGEVADDTWYTVNYDAANGSLYTVDPATGDYTLVGATGYSLTGLAFDHNTGTMYASGYDGANSQLYTLNLDTGAATHVGQIGTGIIIGMAADADGIIYGINLDDNLYTIDATTGAGTLVGPLGVTINYAQDIAFDRDNDVLYGALYTTTGGLYTIDVTTGAATLINNFVAEVAGFGIPYTTAEDAAPAAVADLTATAGALGALEVTLAWTNPSTQFDGGALTELTSVIVERGGVVIETIASPVIGGEVTFVDDDITEAGTYTYRVYGVNTVGEGPKTAVGLYVGEDVPAAPGDVTLVADGNNGIVTWTAPTEGLNGGYLSGDNITYTVVRMPGAVEVATDITAVEFTDTTVPGIGNYFYIVTASNAIGEGGFAASNAVLLGAEGILLYETFDYEIGAIPPGWTVEAELDPDGNNQGDGMVNWGVSNTSTAGGTAPQMRFTWNPRFEGMSRLITGAIDTDGNEQLRLRFNQFLSNFSVVTNTLAVRASFDGGDTWTDLWTHDIIGNIPAHVAELYIDVPADKSTMHLAWEFNGDAYQINNWDLDNIILEPVLDNDLVALSISGNTTPSEGVENMYTITVQNAGTVTQSDYTVKLMQEGDVEIASVAGTAIEFGETLTFDLPWTPAPGETGPTYLYGVVEFAADELPGNNQTANLNVVVQPGDIIVVTIGTGTNYPNVRMPFDFFWRNSLTQSIYYPEEIGMGGGVITGVQYTNNFATDLPDREIAIWIGETELDNLSDGFIDPATLQLVFEGSMDFPVGENNIFINFDDIYIYTGGNLVIYTQRVWEQDYYSSNDRFYGTEDPGSNRTRRRAADGTSGLDPLNPEGGATSNWHPNTSIYFSTAGLGALEGTVTDGTDPVEDVLVRVLGTMASTHTDADGFYEFPYLLPDTYNVEFSKFGYETTVVNGVVVEDDETTIQDATLTVIPTFTVSGTVEGNDGVLQEGAMVTLEGYDSYSAVTDVDGEFTIEDVFEGTYELTVVAELFDTYVDDNVLVDQDIDLTITLIETITPPFGLTIDIDGQDEGNALFSWNEAQLLMLFQHDGEIPGNPNAFYQTDAKVYGTVFDLTDYPDATVSYLDFHHLQWGLPSASYPYLVHIVDWATFTVLETVGPLNTTENDDWEEMVSLGGVNVAGYNQVAILIQPQGNVPTDAYPCLTTDATGPSGLSISADFNNLAGYVINDPSVGDFFFNLWISTAYGGEKLIKAEGLVAENIEQLSTRKGEFTSLAENTVSQSFVEAPAAAKAFEGFNVFLDGVEVASEIDATSYLFTGLEEGSYTAGVQSVYTTGESEIVTLDFDVVFGVPATFTVTTNSGDSPEGAHVVLTNQDHGQYVYEHTVGADGVAHFPSVRKGMYTLHVTHELYHDYIVEDIDIQDTFTYTAELEEIITEPYGLAVETEGLEPGEALFMWNLMTDREFRYDDGTATGQLGAGSGTLNTVLGSAHRNDAVLQEMSWYLTAEGGPHNTVKVWVFGLDANGQPNPQDVLYEMAGVANTDAQWNTYEFTAPVEAPNGFLIGLSYAGFLGIGTDAGTSTEWPFMPNSNFFVFNYTSEEFAAIESLGDFPFNFLIRAFGTDNGELEFSKDAVADNSYGAHDFSYSKLSEPVVTGFPVYNHSENINKAFVGYNVFLNGTEVASEVTDTEYLFTNLPDGMHTAGVQSVYTSGVSEIVTIDFETSGYVIDTYPVTFTVNDLSENYQAINIKGQMTDPQWENVPMTEGPDHVWTVTLDVAPGTHEWGIIEDDGSDDGIWLLPPGDNLQFTLDAEGNITGTITYDLPVNVEEFMNNNISMFPNPSNEIVTLRSGINMSEIRVMDMSGRVVYTSNVEADEHQINVRSFESGIYFVQIVTAEGIFTGKLQVQK